PLTGQPGQVQAVAWSPDGQTGATGSLDRSVRLWTAKGAAVVSHPNLGNEILGLAFTPDGKRLLLARGAGVELRDCSVLDLKSGKLLCHFDEANDTCYSVALHPTRPLAAVSSTADLFLFNTE